MRRALMIGVGVLLSCGPAFAETGTANLKETSDDPPVAGSIEFADAPDGLKVSVSVSRAPAGKHGLHIHQFGSCEDRGNAAGGHYNPDGVAHGFLPKDGLAGAHAGDLGNIEIGPDGTGRLELTVPGVSLGGGKYTVGGRSVVLHDKPDDFGQPTGNAGGRIGCGIIAISGH